MIRNTYVYALTTSVLLAACAGSGDDSTSAPDDTLSRSTASATLREDLELALEVPRSSVLANEPVHVDVTITNVTDHEVRVLRRDTPVDGIEAPIFDVRHNGKAIRYLGMIVNWAEPGPENYLVLKAGESVSKTVDLATAYDISTTGEYSVALAGRSDAGSVRIRAEGRAFVVPSAAVQGIAHDDGSSIRSTSQALLAGCNTPQTDQIRRSWGTARDLVTEVNAFFTQPPRNGPRYNMWFGTSAEYRWGVIASRYRSIAQALDARDVDCSTCTGTGSLANTLAYVYTSSPFKIYVCPLFWSKHQTDQAGILIHELSHFAGTIDIVYGESAARSLAANDPISARGNAENYRFFAINAAGLGY